ncbi:MAG: HAD family hydrolase [Paracoccaceae bacterium]
MRVCHIALGGCLTAPPIRFGLTEDTGGHIAYVMGAAEAQAARADVTEVTIVTRAFDAPELGPDHAVPHQPIGPKLSIRRLRTGASGYLSKEALAAELPALCDAFVALLADPAVRPDVIHAHFADAATLAQAAAEAYGIATVYTPHSLGIDKALSLGGRPGPRLAARIAQEGEAMARAGAVILSSRDEAERQVAAYGRDVCGHVHRIWPGTPAPAAPDPARAATLLAGLEAPDAPLILCIARPVRRKNLAALARAFAADPRLHGGANLAILAGQHGASVAGDEEAAEVFAQLRAILGAPHLAGRVVLPMRHAPRDPGALYAHARATGGVFVNPALHEPFGLTILEAAAHGVPVVATRHGGPPDIVQEIGHGRTVEPTDAAALADAIHATLTDRAGWRTASAAALSGIGRFGWEAWAEGAQRAYAEITAPPRAPADPAALVACDIDGTLTGCRPSAAKFRAWAQARQVLYAVATGRSITEARRVLAEWDLPVPDLFVTAVGSEIHLRDATGRPCLCRDWAAHIEADWDRDAILRVLARAGATMQAPIEQRRWKLGLFGSAGEGARIAEALGAAGLPARVVASHGDLIDVLPLRAGKGAALDFAARGFGLTAADVIAAGDSGNDRDMLERCGRGIVVANAHAEIAGLRGLAHLHHASVPHAAGVLEGLRVHGAEAGR